MESQCHLEIVHHTARHYHPDRGYSSVQLRKFFTQLICTYLEFCFLTIFCCIWLQIGIVVRCW
jgi:hypothetical protein